MNNFIPAFAIVMIGAVTGALVVHADTVTTEVDVDNNAPAVGAVEIAGSNPITLTESTTTTVNFTTTVSDANSCQDIDSVTLDFYRSGITAANCNVAGDTDAQNCYPEISCTAVMSGNTCDSISDTSVDYECSVALQFYADPTDATSPNAGETWEATVTVDDGNDTATGTDTEEVNTLLALDVTGPIDYGNLSAGTDTGTLNTTATVTNTGNVDIDPELSGTNMTDGGTNTIAVANQEYADSAVAYGSGTDLSTTPTQVGQTIAQPSSATPVTDDVHFGLAVPSGTPSGTYTGTNTFTATQ
jgi:hypothetical protein